MDLLHTIAVFNSPPNDGSGRYNTTFVIFTVLFVMMMVAVVVYNIRRRR